MSEREDLQEVLDKLGWKCKVPEQREGYAKVEQEPVAWMYDWNIPVERNQEVLHAYKSRNHLTTDLTLVLNDVNDVNDVENIRPLYTSPPTREPEQSSKWWYGKGVEDTMLFLTRKPLSNLAIKEASRNSKDMSFYNGVKWAEQQHGIGVDDE
jgi:hypothetical protein